MLQIDSILSATFLRVNRFVRTVIKNYTVLQNLTDGSSFMGMGSLQNFNRSGSISSYRTGKETSTRTKAKFGRAERVLYGTVR